MINMELFYDCRHELITALLSVVLSVVMFCVLFLIALFDFEISRKARCVFHGSILVIVLYKSQNL